MRRFVVFDIHGEFKQFQNVLKQWNFDYDNDLLISIGDLCDRGTQTFEVLETLLKCKNLILIKGNHDEYLYEFLKYDKIPPMWLNPTWGGRSTVESYKNRTQLEKLNHLYLLKKQVPYYLDEKGNLFCHAGLDTDAILEDIVEHNFWWDSSLFEKRLTNYTFKDERIKRVIAGHIATPKYIGLPLPIITDKYINGDTGSGKNGLLTIMNVDTLEYKQFTT
jgi:serine/threonine protein phosphatase 1